ncbi:LacI family transcriptional regulator [Streptomyces cellulosae]|nr:LacI family transcriptional regulator [Streptomyces cellulosae]
MRMVTGLREVAERAGVSMRTVSNVVRGTGRFSEATRQRVERAVEELGYRPNSAARRLRTGRSGVLLLAVPELTMPYWAELAEHVLREAAARDCTLLVEVTGGRPEAELEIAVGHTDPMVDGIILSPLALDDRAAARAADPAPLVLLGERVHDLPCAHVTVDNTAAAREATEHLLARGRRRDGVVGRRLGRTRGVGVGPCRQSGTRDRMGTASRAGDGQRQAWRCGTERDCHSWPPPTAAVRLLSACNSPEPTRNCVVGWTTSGRDSDVVSCATTHLPHTAWPSATR